MQMDKALTWFQSFFQALVVGPILWISLQESPVDDSSLLRSLQLQEKLSYKCLEA